MRSVFSDRLRRIKFLIRSKSTAMNTVAIRQIMVLSRMRGSRVAMEVSQLTARAERLVTVLPRLVIRLGTAPARASFTDGSIRSASSSIRV